MSDDHDDHQSPIKTPRQLIAVILAAFTVPILVILLLVTYVGTTPRVGAGSDAMSQAATAARIAPVARIEMADAGAAPAAKSGEDVFKAVCSTCHGAGIAGAPKFGDAAAWSARIAQGASTLFDHALKGFQGKAGVMPAKGGSTDLSDFEVERAVVYMANGSGGKLPEPIVPAVAAAPAAAAAAPGPVAAVAPAAFLAAVAAANSSATAAAGAAGAAADPGQKLYSGICVACHGAGVAGAPKFGDKAAWAPRIAEGQATLYEHALKGFQGKNGVMPPRGGSSASDDEVKAAVRYMMSAAK